MGSYSYLKLMQIYHVSAAVCSSGRSFYLIFLKLRAKLDMNLRKAVGPHPAISHFEPVDFNPGRSTPWALSALWLAVL